MLELLYVSLQESYLLLITIIEVRYLGRDLSLFVYIYIDYVS